MAQPHQRVAPGPCPFLGVRPFPCESPGDTDVFPRRPADSSRPHPQLDSRSARARAPDLAIRHRDDSSGVGARLSLGHRAAWRQRNPERTLTPTPSQTVGPFFGFALPFEGDAAAEPDAIRVEGQLLDGAGEPVAGAPVEASPGGPVARCRTDGEGSLDPCVGQPLPRPRPPITLPPRRRPPPP